MKVKQQKAIQRFLVEEFGEQEGQALFEQQTCFLQNAVERTTGKSRNQFKTLVQTILPRIALYQALTEQTSDKEAVFAVMRRYMMEVVAAGKHASTSQMEKIPGFFYIYRRVFLMIMRTTDLQESTQKSGRKDYDIRITRCLWHDACVERGCPELCPLFCDVDDVTYGGLKKIGFTRTKTLGYGGDCCDFHFFRK